MKVKLQMKVKETNESQRDKWRSKLQMKVNVKWRLMTHEGQLTNEGLSDKWWSKWQMKVICHLAFWQELLLQVLFSIDIALIRVFSSYTDDKSEKKSMFSHNLS